MTTTDLAAPVKQVSLSYAEALLRDVPIRGRIYTGGNCLDELVCKKDVVAALTAALAGVTERAGEIVSELREVAAVFTKDTVFTDAADLIAALLAQNAALRAERDRQYDENVHRIAEQAKAEARAEAAEAEVREMALDVLASSGQAQEAYEAQKAAEAERDALRAEAQEMGAGMVTLSHEHSMERARANAAEAREERLRGALMVARAHVANNAEGWSVSRGAARDDLTIVDAALTTEEGHE